MKYLARHFESSFRGENSAFREIWRDGCMPEVPLSMEKLNAAVDWDNPEHVRVFRAAYTLAFMQGIQAPGQSDDDKRRLIESNLDQLSEGKVRFTSQDEGDAFIERSGEYPPTLFGLQYRTAHRLIDGSEKTCVTTTITASVWELEAQRPPWGAQIAIYELKGFKKFDDLAQEEELSLT